MHYLESSRGDISSQKTHQNFEDDSCGLRALSFSGSAANLGGQVGPQWMVGILDFPLRQETCLSWPVWLGHQYLEGVLEIRLSHMDPWNKNIIPTFPHQKIKGLPIIDHWLGWNLIIPRSSWVFSATGLASPYLGCQTTDVPGTVACWAWCKRVTDVLEKCRLWTQNWLVVASENWWSESQLGSFFPTEWKVKKNNVPNHQPAVYWWLRSNWMQKIFQTINQINVMWFHQSNWHINGDRGIIPWEIEAQIQNKA